MGGGSTKRKWVIVCTVWPLILLSDHYFNTACEWYRPHTTHTRYDTTMCGVHVKQTTTRMFIALQGYRLAGHCHLHRSAHAIHPFRVHQRHQPLALMGHRYTHARHLPLSVLRQDANHATAWV